MKREIGLRPRARRDLDGIWHYSVEKFGFLTAAEYIGSIRTALDLLQHNPRLGRLAKGGRSGLRKYVVASHVIYFHDTERAIDVVRILHGRMDWPRHL